MINAYYLVDQLGWNAMILIGYPNRRVSTLQVHREQRTNSLCFPSNICTEIHHLPKSAKDYWKWQPDSVGNFSLNSAWNTIRTNSDELDQCKFIWNKHYASKMSICAQLND